MRILFSYVQTPPSGPLYTIAFRRTPLTQGFRTSFTITRWFGLLPQSWAHNQLAYITPYLKHFATPHASHGSGHFGLEADIVLTIFSNWAPPQCSASPKSWQNTSQRQFSAPRVWYDPMFELGSEQALLSLPVRKFSNVCV